MLLHQDVCATCERLRNEIKAELTEQGKLRLSAGQLKSHVGHAQAKGSFYVGCIESLTTRCYFPGSNWPCRGHVKVEE